MIERSADLRYTNVVLPERAARLLSIRRFDQVEHEVMTSCSVVNFAWEPFCGIALRGCNRAAFQIRVSAEAYDSFFNSPSGYRAQYALSLAEGEDANRKIIETLLPSLNSFASATSKSEPALVAASLSGSEAKIWIDEAEVQAQLLKADPAIAYEPWEENRSDGTGLLAPCGHLLEVKGAWLDTHGCAVANPGKPNRSMEIHLTGYT